MNISRRMLKQRKISPEVYKNLPIKLDVGCGDIQKRRKDGFMGVDIYDFGQEVIWDIEDGLPFPDHTVSEIFCEHTLEHLEDPVMVLNEFHRLLVKDGKLHIIVPHVTHPGALVLTHKWTYNEFTFEYLGRVEKVIRYGILPWEMTGHAVNRHKDLHVYLKPIDV